MIGDTGPAPVARALDRIFDAPLNFTPEDLSTPVTVGSQAKPAPAFKAFLSLARFFSPDQLNRPA